MENVKDWLYIIVGSLSVLFGVASIILAALAKSKNSRVSKTASNILAITEMARVFIAQAEGIAGFTGPTKKEWVITKLNDFAIKNSISFNQEQAEDIVEKLIDLTNKVNTNKPVKKEETL